MASTAQQERLGIPTLELDSLKQPSGMLSGFLAHNNANQHGTAGHQCSFKKAKPVRSVIKAVNIEKRNKTRVDGWLVKYIYTSYSVGLHGNLLKDLDS